MGLYIGVIEQKVNESGAFFNFKPIAEVKGSQVNQLIDQDQVILLPESEKRNICFMYNWNNDDERRRMDDNFSENSLVLFEFTLQDLSPNYKPNGERNQTGYKVSAMKMLDEGKIRPLGNAGIYFAVRKGEVVSDFTNDAIVEIEPSSVPRGNQVLVEMDDFWAGPYEVGYREYTSSYYVKPQIKEHKYTVSGYSRNQIKLFNLNYSDGHWDPTELQWLIVCPKEDAEPEQYDVISDSVLIESFKDSIESEITANGLVKIDDVPALLKQYEESEIMGTVLTDETRHARLNRLINIMSSEEDVDDTLRTITDLICDLLIKYQDSPNVDKWLQALVEKHPRLLDQLQRSQAISKHITELEDKLEALTTQQGEMEHEIEETRQRAASIDQQAIEAKKNEMLEREKEYETLSARIEEGKKLLGVVEDIVELQKRKEAVEREVDFIETHNKRLDSVTSNLELQFQQLISNQHEKMVEIAFDGFMSSKMLRAAAEWENEQVNNQYRELTSKIASIPVVNKEPEELIEYLCRVVQICRPNYSKNTIINIAICLTQGFLTVFSGEPGCGKTSICNIFGEALGLNKIIEMVEYPEESKEAVGRYVAVSVERGWTSKRDFVGYYNPLSKTFDKSNRRIYNALHQLDTEKQAGICKLPYIILLDEANLSPMEYYWSDFMNICDDLDSHSKVNLGEDYVFGIPETLHFVATINNDHTTETLSPRLIDRAWIITLPQLTLRDYSSLGSEVSIPAEEVEVISWDSLRNTFIPEKNECIFTSEIQKCYDSIIAKLREKKFSVSPRIDMAIKQYWAAASKYFEMDDTKTTATVIALDYAIAQRILPKIVGDGEEFEKWLKEFGSLCSSNGLNTSATMLKDIIERGNQKMKYYQFFC
ncbi:MAG: hypothetical protein LUG99_05285 [Lachnospiraceae bacterium]|nr:hypothetical protein [Lachnospiraceae bacterium]